MSDENKQDGCERCEGSGKAFGKVCDHADDSEPRAALPERDLSRPAEAQGQFRKFEVRRVDGSDQPGGKHYGCHNFVLDLTHDQAARPAIRAYISAVRATHPQLADELEAQYGEPNSLGDLLMPKARREAFLARQHDNLRDRIGQAIADEIHSGAPDADWLDSREVDRLADAALAVISAGAPDELRTFLLNHIQPYYNHEGRHLERMTLAHNDVWILHQLLAAPTLDSAPQADEKSSMAGAARQGGADEAILARQVADWTKERDRLQDLIDTATPVAQEGEQSTQPTPSDSGSVDTAEFRERFKYMLWDEYAELVAHLDSLIAARVAGVRKDALDKAVDACREIVAKYVNLASEGKIDSIKRNRNNWKVDAASECADAVRALHSPATSSKEP